MNPYDRAHQDRETFEFELQARWAVNEITRDELLQGILRIKHSYIHHVPLSELYAIPTSRPA